ncbi:MAG: PQQ-binding-like beta-propeller repeat protein, partial [Gammaproteobacteria bacterium]|nr:PQQ-binding-like beta-propeller repeat protein [Gammaproteobacteria bacterium]
AMDMTTNRLRWQQLWGESCYSGSAVTAGGLVFVGRNDGRFTALDSSDGTLLWEFQTGAGVNAPSSVFEHEGRQHVVVYSAGNLFARSAKGDSVWLFSLDGALGPADPPRSTSAMAVPNDAETDLIGDAERGRQVYVSACIFCHGDQGQGGHDGAALNLPIAPNVVSGVVAQGRNLMPAFGTVLTPQQISDVAAYVADGLTD